MRTGRIAFATLMIAGLTSGAALALDSGQSTPGRVTPQEAAQPGQQVQADGFGGQETQLPGAAGVREQALTQKADGNQQQRQQQGQQAASAQPGQDAPEGWVLVQERVIVLTANEPQNHFLRAQQFLAQNDAKAAAGELRMAAAYMDMQASRGRGQADSQLTQSADQLRQLAGQIGQQQQQMKQAFAQANCALAKHLQTLAQRELQNQKNVMAGHDLNSAADSLAAAYAWSGQQVPQDVSRTIQESQRLAVKLMMPDAAAAQAQEQQQQADAAQTAAARIDERGGQTPQDAGSTIEKLGNAIQQARGAFDGSAGGSGAAGGGGAPQQQQQQQGQQQSKQQP